jgi:uncharacterized repeat protein (TIGR03803 family)
MRSRRHARGQARYWGALTALVAVTLGGSAAGAEKFSVLYSFKGPPDGQLPDAALIDLGGTLYGTTEEGGAHGYGTVFSLTPAGAETVLYSFKGGADGVSPNPGLINVGGVLYGTTYGGGLNNCGTVFTVTPAGAENVLYAFNCSQDGEGPQAGLIDVGGTLYGTNSDGGTGNSGTVFKVTNAGKETVLHAFGTGVDGIYPEAGLINVGGTLYGTTVEGGANNLGTVFQISPAGAEKVLYSFQAAPDANSPVAPLLNVGGTLYGTAAGYGNSFQKRANNYGAVFAITLQGQETVLYSFKGPPDGMFPEAGLITVKGNLYGTTAGGGEGKNCGNLYCGTIFKLTPAGVETILHSFSPNDGSPNANLLKLGNLLYGTASEFDAKNNGNVFTVEYH